MMPPFLALVSLRAAGIMLVVDAWLVFYPRRDWPWVRGFFQLLYSLFNFRHNLIDDGKQVEEKQRDKLSITCMHPHGVIPIQGYLWVAFCDQYLHDLYGYGGTTDIAMTLPLLGNILGWVSGGSASRRCLKRELENGRNLFMLPGGVAEIFLSERGTNRVKAKRFGLMKLALQTGACLVPTYVFGGNDFFDHLATYGNSTRGGNNMLGDFLLKLSRVMKGGFTLFWGQYGLPIPYPANVSLVMGDPIWPVPGTVGTDEMNGQKTCRKVPNPTDEQVSELLDRYVDGLERLFDQYKAQAGCPDATLEVS